MDSRIIMLLMTLTTFIAYPFLSASDRKQIAPLATHMDEPEDEEELEDEDEPVMMDDDEVSDLQIDTETLNIRAKASDQQIVGENKNIKDKTSDAQLSKEDNEEDFN